MKTITVLSFGGGVQTTALAVLWARGDVDADACVMADTGGETPETYTHVEKVRAWLRRWDRDLEVVRHPGGSLEDWTLQRSTPIPIRTRTAFGHRQCTNKWKIEPVKRWARDRGADQLVLLLGISTDEVRRVKPDRERWVERRYPLLDARLSRADCLDLAREAGLGDPPKSACFYCPLQSMDRWRWLAAEHPDLFARAQLMEHAVNDRRPFPDAFMTGSLVPLRNVPRSGAMLPGMSDLEDEECEGTCFV